jgi:hypothetical protein
LDLTVSIDWDQWRWEQEYSRAEDDRTARRSYEDARWQRFVDQVDEDLDQAGTDEEREA